MRRILQFVFVPVLLALPVSVLADRTNGIKDRDYYQAQDAKGYFGTEIRVAADMPTYRVYINSAQGVSYTLLAMLDAEDDEGCWGYVAAGQYDATADASDDYSSSNFASEGYFDRTPPAFDEIFYTDGERRIRELFIPSYIVLNSSCYVKSPTSGYQNNHYDELKDKKFKVVGIDFGAFASMNSLRIVLPSSLTYIGTAAFRASGPGEDAPEGGIDFWDGVAYDTNKSYDSDKNGWLALNNIESIAQNSFRESTFQYFEKMFNPAKLRSLGPVSGAGDGGNMCFYRGSLKALDLTSFAQIKEIPIAAFQENDKKLASVALGGNIEKIHERAFLGCKVLESVTLNCPNLTLLGEEAFSGCAAGTFSTPTAGLQSVDLTGCTSLTALSSKAFYNCYRLSTLKLPTSLTTIGTSCFYYNGFNGRFDIPDHITDIEAEAFSGCRISYIPISDRAKPLRLGYFAFRSGGDLTVDLSATTSVPEVTATGGRPFDVTTSSRYKVRIIVPVGQVEKYVANKTGIGSLYKHREYRVKFNLNNSYELPDYVKEKAEADQWRVASAAWDNDIYTFQPYHGGTVDTWTSSASTNQAGETKDLYTATTSYYYANDGTTANPEKGALTGTVTIRPRTAHTYHANENVDDIPRIGTAEVSDGIVPPGVGILLAYTKPAVYLVPPFDDWVAEKAFTNAGVKRYNVTISGTSIGNSTIDTKRLLATSGATSVTDEATLNSLKGGNWIDVEEQLAKVRVMSVYDDDGTTSEIKAVDLKGTFNFGNLTTVTHWTSQAESRDIPFVHGQEIDLDATCTNGQKKYVFDTSKPKDETDFLYMEYTIDSNFDFYTAYVSDGDDRASYIAARMTPTGAGYGGRDGFNKVWQSTPRYWYNIFDLVATETETGNIIAANREYARNHQDKDNVLAPCIEPTYVWPYYQTVTAAEYEAETTAQNKTSFVSLKTGETVYLIGKSAVELTPTGDYGDGYISFGLSNGYFVQATNPGNTQANRAYFRVHTSHLHSTAHKPTTTLGKAVIVDESDFNETDGIQAARQKTTIARGWYTAEGLHLSGKPQQKGLYICDGKKVVIK